MKMKNFFGAAFVLVLQAAMLPAQSFPVDTLLWNGPADERINVVLLPDGYTAGEMEKFREDASEILTRLMGESPFAEYETFFNAVAILVPSEESGASHPGTATDVNEPVFPVAAVNNRFGSRFDVGNIHRLLVPTRRSEIFVTLADNFPLYDQVMVLVNTPHYGGSGGTFATTSLHPSAPEIAIHEIGHSFAGLADEYYAGDQYARETYNMTMNTDPATVRWKNWYGVQEVGIYQHCCGGRSAEFYRPHQDCKMRRLGPPFCAVCKERIIDRIYEQVDPVRSVEPGEGELFLYRDDTVRFSLVYLDNGQGNNEVVWEVDTTVLSTGDRLALTGGDLGDTTRALAMSLLDPTVLSRSYWPDTAYRFTRGWTVRDCGGLLPLVLEGDEKAVTGTETVYRAQGLPGSAFEWEVTLGGTIVSGNGTDSVTVLWTGATGEICVREVTREGCYGEPVCLSVELLMTGVRRSLPDGWELRWGPNPSTGADGWLRGQLPAGGTLSWTLAGAGGQIIDAGALPLRGDGRVDATLPFRELTPGTYWLGLRLGGEIAWIPWTVQ